MTILLDLLGFVGHATWQPVWIPLLIWTGMTLPLWSTLKWTDRLHPLAEYRLVLDLAATVQARTALPGSTPPRIQARASRIARRLEVTRPVQICRTPRVTAPFTLGG